MNKPVILTGLRATNDLHIGNYFGGVLPLIEMAQRRAEEYQVNLMVADLHTLTTPTNYTNVQKQVMHNIRSYVAAGLPIDHADVHLYRQSYIPAHSELTWIFDCFTGMGEMNRMTQFKDKSAKLSEDRISVGLFNYPVLMATDMLLYGASYVPVGEDQSQHLEYTRDIADRLNNQFGDILTMPRAVKEQHQFFGKGQGLRIKDLIDPTKKMSKTDETGKGVIFMSDDPELAAKKIMSATTDDKAYVRFDRESQPGISNLLEIVSLLRGQPLDIVIQEFEGQTRYGDFKKEVAHEITRFLAEFQAKLAKIDEAAIRTKLVASEKAMNEQANVTLYRVQQAVGLRPRSE